MTEELIIPIGHMPESPGIYKIIHSRSGDSYVGQSTNMQTRAYQHLHKFRVGGPMSKRLKECCRTHGPEHFTFEVLEECGPEQLGDREQHWITELKPTLNSNPGGRFTRREAEEDPQITITMDRLTYLGLEELAEDSFRTPEQQARFMLETLSKMCRRDPLALERALVTEADRRNASK